LVAPAPGATFQGEDGNVGYRRNLSFHHGFGEGRLTTPKPVGAEVNTCDGFRFASLFDG
jgi:hypothetical protein